MVWFYQARTHRDMPKVLGNQHPYAWLLKMSSASDKLVRLNCLQHPT